MSLFSLIESVFYSHGVPMAFNVSSVQRKGKRTICHTDIYKIKAINMKRLK